MIKSIQYKNFKVLRDATLPLSPFTLIIGSNGSGKSTAMQALALAGRSVDRGVTILTSGVPLLETTSVGLTITWEVSNREVVGVFRWQFDRGSTVPGTWQFYTPGSSVMNHELTDNLLKQLYQFRIFAFDATAIAAPVQLEPNLELASNGANLAGVLDSLRDTEPERFEALNIELGRWLPEYDRILFTTPNVGQRAFLLRTRHGRYSVPAHDLSQGTLFALAFLTLAYLPNPPSIVCFEDPDHGMHPRLLHEIRDSMYRLCYPETYGEQRPPVQVIATTHSPYLLDLYKDHPEEVVIAQKDDQGAHFERLSDKPNVAEFLQDAPLGEVWYSGILGGIPSTP